jgi:hypothetical protein
MFCAVRLYIKQHADRCENFTGGLIVFWSAESAERAWRGNGLESEFSREFAAREVDSLSPQAQFLSEGIMLAYSSQQNEYRREVHPMFHGA